MPFAVPCASLACFGCGSANLSVLGVHIGYEEYTWRVQEEKIDIHTPSKNLIGLRLLLCSV